MKPSRSIHSTLRQSEVQVSELLILADGTVLAHNLTSVLADVLNQLDLREPCLRARVGAKRQKAGSRGAMTKK
jgi:hypothetical protein